MKIETKLNIGDDCYFIENNQIKKGRVEKIEITIREDTYNYDISIYYTVSKKGTSTYLWEKQVFASVEETLKYLEANVE